VILPDVNLLVYAHDTASPRHDPAREWWDGVLSGDELVAMPWVAVLGFLRLTTNRRILEEPLSAEEALQYVESWLAQPHVRVVQPGHRHAEHLFRFLRALGVAGNLTTDAHLAALALENGCTLYSTDADFARFPGLDWKNPLL
jgi:toxin-antitoxin system PIN domain toxin